MPASVQTNEIQENWKGLVRVAVWLTASACWFVATPPAPYGWEPRFWSGLGVFLVAGAFGLLEVALRRRRSRSSARLWSRTGAVALLGFVAMAITSAALGSLWTADYNGGRVVIGSRLTDGAAQYVASLPGGPAASQPEALIMDYAGELALIWPQSELIAHGVILGLAYLLTILLAAVAVPAILHAKTCAAAELPDGAASASRPNNLVANQF